MTENQIGTRELLSGGDLAALVVDARPVEELVDAFSKYFGIARRREADLADFLSALREPYVDHEADEVETAAPGDGYYSE
ncbi:hypothetical protein [Sinorhizobium fredii]|uniref:hypothetical protein n=1 Tax=Rhizobium fredii TaxID=380 RepID=UPI0004ADFC96|nr:hypothetical protein [Sinorhizobium fredii]ASY69390.1 hypothetical protein SF83666_c19740 [Sinorhizobium fredii CCBAU 83666]